jgi:hypothetical protein
MFDVLIKAEGVSKKFCKSLKRLMFYGVQDIARSIVGMSEKTAELKPGEFWANNDIFFEQCGQLTTFLAYFVAPFKQYESNEGMRNL